MAEIDLRHSTRQPARDPQRTAGILLAAVALLAAIALLAISPRVLVSLSSDRDGQPLLPAGTVAPGGSVTGGLILANEGLLPLRYQLRVQAGEEELAQGVIIRVRRNGAANYLYQGRLSSAPIPIGVLEPGQRDRLEVTLFAPPSQATESIPIDDTFIWTARSPGITDWWWLAAVALVLVLGAFSFPRLLDLAARLRRVSPLPFEWYWRPPLILAIVILAMLVPLSGVSLASVNSQASNPGNVFAVGSIVLGDQTPTGSMCMSVAGGSTNSGPTRCAAIFNLTNAVPGTQFAGVVTLRNLGTVPISSFQLFAPDACQTRSAAAVAGGADICGRVRMQIHDDSHDRCYFPADQAGPCTASPAGTLRSFGSTYTAQHPLTLRPDGLGSGIVYRFTVSLDSAAGNDYQGQAAGIDFNWTVAQ